MLAICCTIYLNTLEMSPYDTTYYMCLIVLPEALQVFWGILAEYSNNKRANILMAATVQFIGSIVCYTTPFNTLGGFVVAAMVTVAGKAWMSPCIESLMVVQMKNDPRRGAEDLETFGIFFQAIGAFFYCVVAGCIISAPKYVEEHHDEPRPLVYFLFSAFIAMDIFLIACIYPKASENHGIRGHEDDHGNDDHHHHELSIG